MCTAKHILHGRDFAHVPSANIAIKRYCIAKCKRHNRDSRHVPTAQILIELAHVLKQPVHISDLLGAPLADVSILSLGLHGIVTPCFDGLFDVNVGSDQPLPLHTPQMRGSMSNCESKKTHEHLGAAVTQAHRYTQPLPELQPQPPPLHPAP